MIRRLKIEFGSDTRTVRLPSQGELFLGSSSVNDVVVPVRGVSRRHARLCLEGDGLRWIDLGSHNGLIFQGRRLKEVRLTPGQELRIGQAKVLLEEVATSDAQILGFEGSSSVHSSMGDCETESNTLARRTPAAALRLIRRYHGTFTGGRAWRQFLTDARDLLGARNLLHLQTAEESSASPVILDASGPLPSAELCLRLVGLESAREPCLTTVARTRCLRMSVDAHGRLSVVAALFDAERQGEVEPWVLDFFEYLAARFAQEPSGLDTAQHRQPTEGDLVPPPGMVSGESPGMAELLEQIRASLPSLRDVLIEGETGTGKELVARLIHGSGTTADGPFVAVNCAAIPGELLEAELFGVVRGVATGVEPRTGLFELAEGGTLLLDEIAELPGPLQAKLLRVLQEREIRPLGASPRTIHVRVVATCNCNLWDRVRGGRFRKDMYFRLRRLRFIVPPLRERREDVHLLACVFAQRAATELDKRIRGISRRALSELEAYSWPGNVRELQAVVERALLQCRHGEVLESKHLRGLLLGKDSEEPERLKPAGEGSEAPPIEPRSLKQRLQDEERRALCEALAATGGNRSRAARRLQVSRQGFLDKLRRLGLDERFD